MSTRDKKIHIDKITKERIKCDLQANTQKIGNRISTTEKLLEMGKISESYL